MSSIPPIARQVLGWFFILLGVIGIFLPVVPQIPFLAVGALLLAPHVRAFGRLSAWIHQKFPRWRGPLRRFRDFKKPPPAQKPDGVSR
jgi:uncharacterized protein